MLIGLKGVPASAADDRISSNIFRIMEQPGNKLLRRGSFSAPSGVFEHASLHHHQHPFSPWASRHHTHLQPACTDSLTAQHPTAQLSRCQRVQDRQDASSLGNAWPPPPPPSFPWCDKEQAEQPCIVLPQVASRPARQLVEPVLRGRVGVLDVWPRNPQSDFALICFSSGETGIQGPVSVPQECVFRGSAGGSIPNSIRTYREMQAPQAANRIEGLELSDQLLALSLPCLHLAL